MKYYIITPSKPPPSPEILAEVSRDAEQVVVKERYDVYQLESQDQIQ